MTLEDLELLAREGKAGALALADADAANADQLRSIAMRFEVAENRVRSAAEFIAQRAAKAAGQSAVGNRQSAMP